MPAPLMAGPILISVSSEAFDTLQRLKRERGFQTNSEAINQLLLDQPMTEPKPPVSLPKDNGPESFGRFNTRHHK
jgi:hypothetical protein